MYQRKDLLFMKKKLMVFALSLCMIAGLSGCQKKYVTLGDYKGLELSKIIAEVSDEELKDDIDTTLSDNADSKEITDRGAQNGDTITMDFEGKIDGTAFEGGSAEDYDLELGSDSFIDGFEEQLIGLKKGEKKDVTVTFPEDYGDETLNGKEAVFSVTLKAVKEIIPAVYNDEFVSQISDFKTTADYEENLKNELLASKEEDAESTLQYDALNTVIESSKFDGYPEELYKKCEEQINQTNAYYAEMFGVSVDQIAGTEEDVKQAVLAAVNQELVVEAISEKEKLSVTDDEYKQYVNDNLDNFEVASLEEFEESNDKESVKQEILTSKVCQYLVEQATVTDVTEDEKYQSDEDTAIGETEPPMDTEAASE